MAAVIFPTESYPAVEIFPSGSVATSGLFWLSSVWLQMAPRGFICAIALPGQVSGCGPKKAHRVLSRDFVSEAIKIMAGYKADLSCTLASWPRARIPHRYAVSQRVYSNLCPAVLLRL